MADVNPMPQQTMADVMARIEDAQMEPVEDDGE